MSDTISHGTALGTVSHPQAASDGCLLCERPARCAYPDGDAECDPSLCPPECLSAAETGSTDT